jgi:hypothetical protein
MDSVASAPAVPVNGRRPSTSCDKLSEFFCVLGAQARKAPANSTQPALERVPYLVQDYSQACSKTTPYFFSSWTWSSFRKI